MKKLFPFLFFVLALSLQAQDPEIWQTYRLKAKQGQSDAFEKAAAKKNKLFNNTPETAIITYQVMDGNDQGMYERIVGYKDWDFYNNESKNEKEYAYWAENVTPFVEESTGWTIWFRAKEACHNWNPESKPAKHIRRMVRIVKPGGEAAFWNVHFRMKQVYEKYGWTGVKGLFRVASGGNTNMFIIVSPFNKFGEEDKFEKSDKNLEQLYNDMFGYQAWQTDLKAYNEALVDWGRSEERLTLVKSMN